MLLNGVTVNMAYFKDIIPSIRYRRILSFALLSVLILLTFLPVLPAHANEYTEAAEARKAWTVETNEISNWPIGPAIGAEAALLMEMNTGAVLYAKNIHAKLYPASITKLLTAYIAMERCSMEEMVTFSPEAVYSINWREDANMGINPGSSITMREALYGILVGSANEAAYAVAQHISGSVEAFAELMNETARQLGCTDSNFVNANGIHDQNHYTSAHDMGLIAQAFFSNELLAKMSGTTSYAVATTETQPKENLIVNAKSKLLPGKEYAYEYLVGTKTGYTNDARQTLVSCAQHNGLELICVILNEETPAQFTDTIELFNYGFENFSALNISDIDTKYSIDNSFFTTESDFFGGSQSILSLSTEDYIVLPNTLTFEDTLSEISYESAKENEIASIHYTYEGVLLGKISVELATEEVPVFDFGSETEAESTQETPAPEEAVSENIIFINIRYVIIICVLLLLLITLLFTAKAMLRNRRRSRHRRNRLTRKMRRERQWGFDDLDF